MTTTPILDGDPKNPYTATGGQTTFAYTFWVNKETHIAVYVNDVLQSLTTDYTVSQVQDVNGGDIVFVSGLTAGDSVVLVYDPDFERESDYTGTIRLDALNTELTYLLTLLQSNQRKIDDALRTSDTEIVTFSGELPSLTGNGEKILRLKSDLSGIEYVSISGEESIIANFESNTFSGDNSTTDFTLTFTVTTENQLLVWVDNVRQLPGTDYSVTGTTLSFTVAPPTGTDNIEYLNIGAATDTTTVSDGAITEAKLANNSVSTVKIQDDAVTADKIDINGATDTVITASDEILFSDVSDSNNAKKDTVQGILDLAGGGLNLISTVSASNVASVEFTSGIDSTYDRYILTFDNVTAATDGANLVIQTSSDGGSTYDGGATDYVYTGFDATSSLAVENQTTGNSSIIVMFGVGNAAGEALSGSLALSQPSNSSINTIFHAEGWCMTSTVSTPVQPRYINIAGYRNSAAIIDAVKLFFGSGNILSGEFKLYGVKAS